MSRWLIRLAAVLCVLGGLSLPLVSKTRNTKPTPVKNSVTLGSDVKMTVALSHRFVHDQQPSLVYLHVALDAANAKVIKALPINLALVFDRSGSMLGQKMVDAKKAALAIVGRMKTGDRFSLISYSSNVSVDVASTVVDQSSRAMIRRAIMRLSAYGSTNLSGGMLAGKREAKRYLRSGWVNRVILISDGRANAGITDYRQLNALARRSLQDGIAITTIGVGADYNETVMTGLADFGGGNYYYVRRSAELAAILHKELQLMATTIAQNVALEVVLPSGVELQHLFGYKYTRETRTIVVPLAELFSGQKRSIIVKLKVTAPGKLQHLANVRLSYRSTALERTIALRQAMGATFTNDHGKIKRGLNRDVMIRVHEVGIATTVDKAMDRLEHGDYDGASTLLRGAMRKTRRFNEGVKSKKLRHKLDSLAKTIGKIKRSKGDTGYRKHLLKETRQDAYKAKK